ncbi:hypothetical protein ACFYXS_20180 [Streptomyces sp. NPDC002574]
MHLEQFPGNLSRTEVAAIAATLPRVVVTVHGAALLRRAVRRAPADPCA